ncbi:hypothetical protein KW797_00925 [Candidatus Parcubacteria bacterium]|nr:hypothetical protein [Candidatus Parcubacteria bacterium]
MADKEKSKDIKKKAGGKAGTVALVVGIALILGAVRHIYDIHQQNAEAERKAEMAMKTIKPTVHPPVPVPVKRENMVEASRGSCATLPIPAKYKFNPLPYTPVKFKWRKKDGSGGEATFTPGSGQHPIDFGNLVDKLTMCGVNGGEAKVLVLLEPV